MKKNYIIHADNLDILRKLPDKCINLIYIDPPFNIGHKQHRVRETMPEAEDFSFEDKFDDYIGFLRDRIVEARRILTDNGSFFFHIDYREAAYCKIMLDEVFGRKSFINEIIWAYDYGARSKKRWSAKHDNIYWYAKNPKDYVFNYDNIDRIPYLAPGLVGPEKAARGKTPTSVWFNTIVHTNGKEKTGYPTQKPLKIIERIVRVHSNEGDMVLDFFAGSGTIGEAAAKNNRRFFLIDQNKQAIEIMQKRLVLYPFSSIL